MRTTIDLPDDLLRRAKAEAALAGVSLKVFFTQALEAKLAPPSKKRLDPLPTVPMKVQRRIELTREDINEAMFG
ncbi:MAG: hypothetical protein NW208_06140 [Bryobacter sp.]|nr:hypothetical protein [Bryobacter sp.]